MNKLPLFSAVVIGSALVACGGDPKSESGKPDSLLPPGFSLSSSSSNSETSNSSSSAPSNIVNESIPFHENFDNTSDTSNFFNVAYKALNTDAELPFYFPTGGFLDENGNLSPTTTSWVTDDENRKLQLGNGRFTIGQTRLEFNSTTQEDLDLPTSWGELNLSKAYTVSFCVVEKSGASNLEIFVDNNTTGGNNSRYGGGNASRILQASLGSLAVGNRFSVTVPVIAGGRQIGTEHSFLQFRVSSGGALVIDDLVIEYVGEPHGFTLPECKAETTTPPTPATPPTIPTGLTAIAGDASLVVSWGSAGVGVNYQVSYNTVNDLASATSYAANPVAGNNVQLTELVNGQEYFVWVKAINSAGESDFSEPVSATPAAPVGGDESKAWGFNSFEYADLLAAASGTANVNVSEAARDADGLSIFLNNGSALRYRFDSNAWNFNGNSFRSADSRVPAVGETAAELRAYVGVPVVVGRAATISFIVKQTGSGQIGKAVVVNQLNQVVLITEISDSTLDVPLTVTLDEGHATEELRVFYSREGTGSGGMDLVALRKSYADSPLEEEPASSSSSSDSSVPVSSSSQASSEPVASSSVAPSSSSAESSSSVAESSVSSSSAEVSSSVPSSSSEASSSISSSESSSSTSSTGGGGADVSFNWSSFDPNDYVSILSAAATTTNNVVIQSALEHSSNGLLFFHNATGTLRHRGGSNLEWNFNGTGWASADPVAVVNGNADTMRAYIGVPVDAGKAVTITVVHRNSGSGNPQGAIVFVGSDGKVLAKFDATANTATTTVFSLPSGHAQTQVNITFSREGGGAGGMHLSAIDKTYN